MEQLQTLIKNNRGQMLVEILLAIALTAIMLPALLTGLFASKQGKAQQIQRAQAVALLKESEEIARNLKEQKWSFISTSGTFHPQITGTNWQLVAGNETLSGLTRSIQITDVNRDSNGNIVTSGGAFDPSTKRVYTRITWGTPFPSSVDSTIYLTRYKGNTSYTQTTLTEFNNGTNSGTITTNVAGGEVTLAAGGGGGDWCNPSLSVTSVDLSRQGVPTAISAYEGSIVTGTGGNASGPTFVKTTVSGNNPPVSTFVGEFNNSKANSVFTADNFGYIATTNNGEEIQILNLTQYSNPPTNTAFVKSGYFNAPGNTQGNSVFVSGTVGYMTAADKFYTFDLTAKTGSRNQLNISTPITLNGTGVKIVVVGNYAYVVTDATTNQLQIINVSVPATPSIVATASTGNSRAGVDVSVNASGTRAYLVTSYANTTTSDVFIINTTTKTGSLPRIGIGFNTNVMSPKGISIATGNRLIVVGTGGSTQYQVLNISAESIPVLCGSIAISGGANAISSVLQSDGYAYSYVATGDSNAELKIVLGGAGGQFADNGTFTSSPIDPGNSVTYNYFNPVFVQPNQTLVRFQLAVANAVSNNCTNSIYNFLGPDGTSASYFTGSGPFPLLITGNYSNPGRCFKYKAYLSTSDISSSPTIEDVSVNYSP